MAASATAGGKRIFTPGNINDCIGKVKAAYGATNPITPLDAWPASIWPATTSSRARAFS